MRYQVNFDLNLHPVEENTAGGAVAASPPQKITTERCENCERKKSRCENGKIDETNFIDCNICLDSAIEPVLTLCGHLFCWPCIYKWINYQLLQANAAECPVCKGEVTVKNVIPIYGRGPENIFVDNGSVIPPRPKAPRVESSRRTTFGNPQNNGQRGPIIGQTTEQRSSQQEHIGSFYPNMLGLVNRPDPHINNAHQVSRRPYSTHQTTELQSAQENNIIRRATGSTARLNNRHQRPQSYTHITQLRHNGGSNNGNTETQAVQRYTSHQQGNWRSSGGSI